MARNEETSTRALGLGSPQPYEIGMISLNTPHAPRTYQYQNLHFVCQARIFHAVFLTFLSGSQPVLRDLRIKQPVHAVHSSSFPSLHTSPRTLDHPQSTISRADVFLIFLAMSG